MNSQEEPHRKSTRQDHLSSCVMLVVAIVFLLIALTYPYITVAGQYSYQVETPPPPSRISLPPAQPPFRPPIVVPTDVTKVSPAVGSTMQPGTTVPDVLSGLQVLSDSAFPGPENLKGSTDFILVHTKSGTEHLRVSPYLVTLKSGSLLVAVKKPSSLGMVNVPFGQIAVSANADALITYSNDVLRVANLDGIGKNLKIDLNKGPFAGPQDPVFAVAPGYELIAAKHKLKRSDLRPHDGIARRQAKTIGDGKIAISEISLDSVLRSSELVASMNQKDSGSKERRVISDMSKMAAVLNHVHGSQGYTTE